MLIKQSWCLLLEFVILAATCRRKGLFGHCVDLMYLSYDRIVRQQGEEGGIHQHCSEERLQGYLDEFHFRHNRRSNMETIFDVLIRKLALDKPVHL